MQSSPVAQLAESAGIEVIKPASLREPDILDRLRELAPDVAPIVAYGGLVPAEALSIPAHGWVNLHFSLLPRWRGAAPVQHAIWRGDDVTGASTFLLEEGLDTGPIYGSVIEEISPTDTSGALLARMAELGADLLVETLDIIETGAAAPLPQVGEPSVAPKLTVDDARVRWDVPAFAVDRHIRACTPAPGAWTSLGGERVGLGPVDIVDDELEPNAQEFRLSPGEIRAGKREVLVGIYKTMARTHDRENGNGRAVRNLLERAKREQALRLMALSGKKSKEELMLLVEEDFAGALAEMDGGD